MKFTKKRIAVYIFGLVVLAFGIDLNTKSLLGVSPIISVPYSISAITGWLLGGVIFAYYVLLVLIQWGIRKKKFRLYQFLQIPCAFITSAAVQIFDEVLRTPESLIARIVLLLLAIVVTAIGASLTVGINIVPNPADGLANIIGTALGHGFGFGKNILDGVSIAVSLAIGFLFIGSPLSIGVGTIISMILTGRVIALLEGRVRQILEWTQR